ncbi:hypothetical protein [Mycolicibacter sinensis]
MAGDDSTAELAAVLGAELARRLLALEARVADLERERRRPPILSSAAAGLLNVPD